jgi:hypothetical protein
MRCQDFSADGVLLCAVQAGQSLNLVYLQSLAFCLPLSLFLFLSGLYPTHLMAELSRL